MMMRRQARAEGRSASGVPARSVMIPFSAFFDAALFAAFAALYFAPPRR